MNKALLSLTVAYMMCVICAANEEQGLFSPPRHPGDAIEVATHLVSRFF